MLAIGQEDAVNLLRFFDDLPDPRSKVNRLHRLGDVIVIAICAIIATADGPTAIAKWAKLNAWWLRRHLALPHGIPGKDTFRRVLGLLPPAAFQQCFQQWLLTLQASPEEGAESQKHIAIDGKTLRRPHDRKHGLGPMHIVSAWASALPSVVMSKSSRDTGVLRLARIITSRRRHTSTGGRSGKGSKPSVRPSACTRRTGSRSATYATSSAACGAMASNSPAHVRGQPILAPTHDVELDQAASGQRKQYHEASHGRLER